MHLKVFSKLKKPFKLSLLGKYIKKNKKKQKNKKNIKKIKKKPLSRFFFKPGFFQPSIRLAVANGQEAAKRLSIANEQLQVRRQQGERFLIVVSSTS
jgi:hypothetical protein